MDVFAPSIETIRKLDEYFQRQKTCTHEFHVPPKPFPIRLKKGQWMSGICPNCGHIWSYEGDSHESL